VEPAIFGVCHVTIGYFFSRLREELQAKTSCILQKINTPKTHLPITSGWSDEMRKLFGLQKSFGLLRNCG
jgi:hypothetical protein